jgi:hypothetical protein
MDTLTFDFVGISKTSCPNGDNELACAGGSYA